MAKSSLFLAFAVMAVVSCILLSSVEGQRQRRRQSRVQVIESVERNENCKSSRLNFVFFKRYSAAGFNRVRANEKKCICFLANYQYCGTGVQESGTSTTAAPTTTAAAESTSAAST